MQPDAGDSKQGIRQFEFFEIKAAILRSLDATIEHIRMAAECSVHAVCSVDVPHATACGCQRRCCARGTSTQGKHSNERQRLLTTTRVPTQPRHSTSQHSIRAMRDTVYGSTASAARRGTRLPRLPVSESTATLSLSSHPHPTATHRCCTRATHTMLCYALNVYECSGASRCIGARRLVHSSG